MLSAEQHAKRAGKIGASFVPSLMAGDEAALVREWMRLVEHPAYQPEDLSHVWPVILGTVIEQPALDYHEWKTGHALTRRGEWVPHPVRDFLGCTLDAWRAHDDTVIDCKAPGAYRNLDDVRAYYAGQMVVQQRCTGARGAALLIVHGGAEPSEWECTWPQEYELQVWDRVDWFWSRVQTLQPPGQLPRVKSPLPAIREVDMSYSNLWAEEAATWLRLKDASTAFNIAQKHIKDLVEDDVQRAYGHGITATRDRRGAITIRGA